MRLTQVLILLLFSTAAFAQAASITCQYEYEDYISYRPALGEFTVSGDIYKNKIVFNSVVNHIPSYYIDTDLYAASIWHQDASINFSATLDLESQDLIYTYQYNNFINSYGEFGSVFEQSYRLNLNDRIKTGSATFHFGEGRMLNENINSDVWVNTNNVKLTNCHLVTAPIQWG